MNSKAKTYVQSILGGIFGGIGTILAGIFGILPYYFPTDMNERLKNLEADKISIENKIKEHELIIQNEKINSNTISRCYSIPRALFSKLASQNPELFPIFKNTIIIHTGILDTIEKLMNNKTNSKPTGFERKTLENADEINLIDFLIIKNLSEFTFKDVRFYYAHNKNLLWEGGLIKGDSIAIPIKYHTKTETFYWNPKDKIYQKIPMEIKEVKLTTTGSNIIAHERGRCNETSATTYGEPQISMTGESNYIKPGSNMKKVPYNIENQNNLDWQGEQIILQENKKWRSYFSR